MKDTANAKCKTPQQTWKERKNKDYKTFILPPTSPLAAFEFPTPAEDLAESMKVFLQPATCTAHGVEVASLMHLILFE